MCFVWHEDGAHHVEIVDYHQELNTTKLLDEIHSGEILQENFMMPMGINARKLAADIDVSPSRISELVHGQRPTPPTNARYVFLEVKEDSMLIQNEQWHPQDAIASLL